MQCKGLKIWLKLLNLLMLWSSLFPYFLLQWLLTVTNFYPFQFSLVTSYVLFYLIQVKPFFSFFISANIINCTQDFDCQTKICPFHLKPKCIVLEILAHSLSGGICGCDWDVPFRFFKKIPWVVILLFYFFKKILLLYFHPIVWIFSLSIFTILVVVDFVI